MNFKNINIKKVKEHIISKAEKETFCFLCKKCDEYNPSLTKEEVCECFLTSDTLNLKKAYCYIMGDVCGDFGDCEKCFKVFEENFTIDFKGLINKIGDENGLF